MARAGQSVCLLERGQERWPGEYPLTSKQALRQVRLSGHVGKPFSESTKVQCGNRDGMYHIVVGHGQTAVVANGLGGGSLINSNVFLEADAGTLAMEVWPPQIRNDPQCLEKYYQRVRRVLEPEPYPDDWPALHRTQVFREQAERLGVPKDRFRKVPQTTRFRPGRNACGVAMAPSTRSGHDTTGLNDGSKTTTLVTYLADAWNWGAELFSQCEVRHVEKVRDERGGYLVFFISHQRRQQQRGSGWQPPLRWVHARSAVFLGAGAIGTTEILLRSKAMGLCVSDTLGEGMSGNGDMLAFGYNTDRRVNAMASAQAARRDPVGPAINAAIDMRGQPGNPLDGFVIQEGAVPPALSPLLQPLLDVSSVLSGSSVPKNMRKRLARWKSRLRGPYACGAMQKTQVLLAMSHDSKSCASTGPARRADKRNPAGSQGRLRLENDEPLLQFQQGSGSDRVTRVRSLLAEAVEAVGGTPVYDPGYGVLGNHQVTVHPLGGATMSRDNTGAHGVTNHAGEVFSGTDTSATHRGLVVVDGAAVPAALGVNPLATISALAERAVDEYARTAGLVISKEHNGSIDFAAGPGRLPQRPLRQRHADAEKQPDPAAAPDGHSKQSPASAHGQPPSIAFTECMAGFVHASTSAAACAEADFAPSYRVAKLRGETARLLVQADVSEAPWRQHGVSGRQYSGSINGTFVCASLPGSPFMIRRGDLQIFQPAEAPPETSRFVYDFDMAGTDGRLVRFYGYKTVDASTSFSPVRLWKALTTLFVCITELNDQEAARREENGAQRRAAPAQGRVLAQGILRLGVRSFRKQLLGMEAAGDTIQDRTRNMSRFMRYFAGKALGHLLLPLQPLRYATTTTAAQAAYVNPTSPTRSYTIVASDGVQTVLHMWEPEPRVSADQPPVENLFMIPGASVDHQIFALPTIPLNAVNYFTRAGYRVFVTVHRIGLQDAGRGDGDSWTTYDARLDLRACIQFIRQFWSPAKLYTIAHCMGSVAFASGLLDGTIPADWIRGITCSQVFAHPVWSPSNVVKKASPVPLDRLYARLAGGWFDCRPGPRDRPVQRAINQLLRFYPDSARERCSSAACHRTTFLFGRCWAHENLNRATHDHIDRFFGGASMALMQMLMQMDGNVTGNAPGYKVLTGAENVERLRGIPIFLFSGEASDVLSPAATEKTYALLCSRFGLAAEGGGIQYRRKVFPGYGHLDCWMGRDAWRDVYPSVREEVDRVVRGVERR
ncbi:hypothetical protein UVI_02010290 [Ustilaginoidea virens]|uniref:Cholesterol oxidase n=1 Tax=Ustilaginoidea virens TaxID=1159556 RepID=A0A1B5KWH4_USTVR|nr:hypothetical protein UVI_02010290 [Ustilaginoidea virens]